jgi:Dynamin GTPase effector domain
MQRVIDNIPRAIDLDFIRALGDQVQNALIDKLQIGLEEGRDRAASYVADDPRISLGRDELEGKTARLEQISAKLLSWV